MRLWVTLQFLWVPGPIVLQFSRFTNIGCMFLFIVLLTLMSRSALLLRLRITAWFCALAYPLYGSASLLALSLQSWAPDSCLLSWMIDAVAGGLSSSPCASTLWVDRRSVSWACLTHPWFSFLWLNLTQCAVGLSYSFLGCRGRTCQLSS